MTRRQRIEVAGVAAAGVLALAVLLAFAAGACPLETSGQPCPDVARNRTVVVGLASLGVALSVAPFAFLADFAVHRRIVFRGAWWRAGRRGVLAGLLVAILAGLRLGGALNVPAAIFVVVMGIVVERFVTARGA